MFDEGFVSLLRVKSQICTAVWLDRPIRTQSWRGKAAARSTRSCSPIHISTRLVHSFSLCSCYFFSRCISADTVGYKSLCRHSSVCRSSASYHSKNTPEMYQKYAKRIFFFSPRINTADDTPGSPSLFLFISV